MPLAHLLTDTATSRHNIVINKWEMAFNVLMWSMDARRAIFQYLTEEMEQGMRILTFYMDSMKV